MAEKYTLNWQTFSEHLQLMFKDLYQDGRYTDITLVSDDQTQFKAHKIVLRACSPVFKKIIDNNPSQHPLIYLRGIQSYEMESILQFMYLGEGKLYHERMREFIKVAQDLEVKEISDGVELPSEEAEKITEENTHEEDIGEELVDATPIQAEKTTFQQRRPRTKISNDKKSTQCPECGAQFTQRYAMLKHYRSKHEGGKYPCNQCDYQATQRGDLKSHISAKHSDTVLKCDYCDYQTKWKQKFSIHKKTHNNQQ